MECLETAKRTSDQAVRRELLAAAGWLHEEAIKLETMVAGPGGGGGSTPGGPAESRPRAPRGRQSAPRDRSYPATAASMPAIIAALMRSASRTRISQ
jgi:hypothetical protein